MTPSNGRLAATDKVSSNGHSRYQQGKVRVAIIGVGNCASSLVQGVEYYKSARANQQVPGLMHVDLGGYHIRDIEFSAAFDIDAEKVGKDLSEAIFSGQNNTIRFCEDVPHLNVPVPARHDPLTVWASTSPSGSRRRRARPPTSSRSSRTPRTDVVVSYLPVGSEQATKW